MTKKKVNPTSSERENGVETGAEPAHTTGSAPTAKKTTSPNPASSGAEGPSGPSHGARNERGHDSERGNGAEGPSGPNDAGSAATGNIVQSGKTGPSGPNDAGSAATGNIVQSGKTSVDFHKLLLEIDEEVRAKRASGELPVDVERELDMMFARFAPAGALEGNFEQLLERAEQQAFIDLLAPNESAKPGVPQVKRVVQKTVRWYLRYVVDQVTGFSHTITKAVRLLSERVERVERIAASEDEFNNALLKLRPTFDPSWVPVITTTLKGVSGRVLHTRCASGDLVRELKAVGLDAYGVEPLPELVVMGTAGNSGLDLRADSELAHLRLVAPGTLGGLVLSGGVDILPRGSQIELLDLAVTALSKGGRLVIVASDPTGWQRVHNPIEVDLAPGRPLHAPTWLHLLGERGFTNIDVTSGVRHGSLDHVPGGMESVAAMNVNIDRLNDVLFPPASWLITASR